MFYEDDDEGYINPDILHVVNREIYALTSNLNLPIHVRTAPTHTEDGIPIRKLYVSNLPPKTTRTELFNVFAQYGFIKSCWLRMGDRGAHKAPTPTYAFVTYSNPADAHKALQSAGHERVLRGRTLRISPADSWHQPAEESDGSVRWGPRGQVRREGELPSSNINEPQDPSAAKSSTDSVEANRSEEVVQQIVEADNTSESEESYNIMDILNRDCMTHILSYVPLVDLIRSERVSKTWQNMVQEYFESIRVYKTSWWSGVRQRLTTAVLRRVLQRLGPSLVRLHIDHQLSALNDRTAHTVGKFCPSLEELKVFGMHTKNWNPLLYGCKRLKSLSFISCNKLTDSSLVHLVKRDSSIEDLTVANNTHVTGLFLTGSTTINIKSLSFHNCYSLQGTVLCAALDTLPNLTKLRLDFCPSTMWKIVPLILQRVPRLEELSLSDYASSDMCLLAPNNDAFCDSLGLLTELKVLNLCRNIHINNGVMKQISQTCTKLESLNISSCNAVRNLPHLGVGDEGVRAVCGSCRELRALDVSYLRGLADGGLRAAAGLPRLQRLLTRGNPALTADPLAACLRACRYLEEIDACGCDNVSDQLISVAVETLNENPRKLALWLASTSAAVQDTVLNEEQPTHHLLMVNLHEDRSNPNMRPDFVDEIFGQSSDDSFDDLYEHDLYEDIEDMFERDDELYLEGDDDEVNAFLAYGLQPADVLLL